MALGLRELRSIVSERGMRANGWRIGSARAGCSAFWFAVSQSLDRARRRLQRNLSLPKVADGGPIRTESGEITNGPSRDELISPVSAEDLAAHSSAPLLGIGVG